MANNNDLIGKIIDFEDGNMDEESVVDLFQELLDSGMIYKLQGSYGRQMQAFINQGLVHPPVGA